MGKSKTRCKSITGISLAEVFFYLFAFILSASLGSFYVTLSERILIYFYGKKRKNLSFREKWKKIFFKPSHCEVCLSKIPVKYLIPFFGYIFSKGKCSHCNVKISILYPWSELLFSCWFFCIFLITGNPLCAVFSTFLLGHVFLSMFTDIKKYILDYENLAFIGLFYFLASLFKKELSLEFENIAIGIVFFMIYFLLYKFFPSQMGLGDVFYVTCYSFLLGHPFWMFFWNSAYLSAVGVYLYKKFFTKKVNRTIPMGFYFGCSFLFVYVLKIM